MAKQNLKLVSMRLPENLLSKIDEFTAKRKYLTRTQVVTNILLNAFECSDEVTLWNLIETWDAFSAGYTVHFTSNK